jgi:hypothetical protein
VGPRAGLDTVSKRKIHSPRQESNPNHPVAIPTKLIPVHAYSDSKHRNQEITLYADDAVMSGSQMLQLSSRCLAT